MDLSKLKENIVTQTIKYNGQEIKLELRPSIFTNADNELSIADYVAKGLKSWDLTSDEEPLPITADTLTSVIPDGVLTLIFDTILHLKEAQVGKLKTLK